MKVKEFLEVVPFSLIDYAKIYEMRWNENYQDYDSKYIDKRVKNKKDLEPYYDCELDYFDYETQWGEYDDSTIYIKMPKEEKEEDLNMSKECQYTREQLLEVMKSYLTMIERDNGKHPTVVLDDISKSIEYVLKQNGLNCEKE